MNTMNKSFVPYDDLTFINAAHKEAFATTLREVGSPAPVIVLTLYLLTATEETNRRIWEVITADGLVVDDLWSEWEQEDSRRVMGLLLNLTFNDSYEELTPSHLFDSQLCPVLMDAITYWRKAA